MMEFSGLSAGVIKQICHRFVYKKLVIKVNKLNNKQVNLPLL